MRPESILLFELGGRRMAARIEGIRRIAPKRDRGEPWLLESALGSTPSPTHGLVVETPAGERVLGVDRVLGPRDIAGANLHPMPRIAAEVLGMKGLCGIVPLDGELTLLLDVSVFVSELETMAAEPRLEGEAR